MRQGAPAVQRSTRVLSLAVAAITSLALTGCEDNLLLQDRPEPLSQVTPTAITPPTRGAPSPKAPWARGRARTSPQHPRP